METSKPIKYISISICGNPQTHAGWSDIAMFNSADFNLADGVYGGFSHLDNVYTVRIEESGVEGARGWVDTSKIIFTLSKNRVRSYGASREGRLKIAFSIPKGWRMPDGVDPKMVMDEIEKTFIEKCMTGPDTNGMYNFRDNLRDTHVVDEVGLKYPLVPAEGPFRGMNPKGDIAFMEVGDPARIKEVFEDVQYPEFSQFREVIVAESSQGSTYQKLVGLKIPRSTVFKIYSSKDASEPEFTGQTVRDPEQEVFVPAPAPMRRFYRYDPIRFRLSTPCSNVRIDRVGERVDVTFFERPEVHTYRLEFQGGNELARTYLNRYASQADARLIFVRGEGQNLRVRISPSGEFQLKGRDNECLLSGRFKVKINDFKDFRVQIEDTFFEQETKTVVCRFVVHEVEKKSQVPAGVNGDNGNRKGKNGKEGKQSSGEERQVESKPRKPLPVIAVRLDAPELLADGEYLTVSLKESGNLSFKNPQAVYRFRKDTALPVKKTDRDDGDTGLEWHVLVPEPFMNGSPIDVKVETDKWSKLYMVSTHNFKNGGALINVENRELNGKSSVKRVFSNYWHVAVITILSLAIVGILWGTQVKDKIQARAEAEKTTAVDGEVDTKEGVSPSPVEQAEELSSRLMAENLDFITVRDIADAVQANPAIANADPSLAKRAQAYLAVTDAIGAGDWDALDHLLYGHDTLPSGEMVKELIHPVHMDYLHMVGKKADGTTYGATAKEQAKMLFKAGRFNKFQDLSLIRETVEPS